MRFNLDGKKFCAEKNSSNGEVGHGTVFTYHQSQDIVWAEYSGGEIIRGTLIGKVINESLSFVYQHINSKRQIMTGECRTQIEKTPSGKLRLLENWQWTCHDYSKGESTLIDV